MILPDKQFRRLLRSTVALPLVFGPIAASAQSAAVEAAMADALRAAQQQRPDLSRQLRSAARIARTNPVVASTAAAPSMAAAGGSGFSLSTLGYVAGGVLVAGAGVAGAVAMGDGGGGDSGGGSSSGSSGSTTTASRYIAAPEDANPTIYETTEYNERSALAAVGASEAYAIADNAGEGQIIAILDSGVSATALAAGKIAGSASVFTGGADPRSGEHHGTQVASVAVGAKDGVGAHGIAYESQVFAVRWADYVGSETYITNGFNTVAGQIIASGASVFNASFGFTDYYAEDTSGNISRDDDAKYIKDANIEEISGFARMMNAGLVGVFSVSNYASLWNDLDDDGIGDTLQLAVYQPDESQLLYAQIPNLETANGDRAGGDVFIDLTTSTFDFSDLDDKMLAVVNVSNDGSTLLSQGCGAAKDWCVSAPGTGPVTDNDGHVTNETGSSFAAPLVSGMVAVIKSLYPFLSNVQIVALIKDTATDLGVAGVDERYGHGMVDLAEALSFQGVGTVVGHTGTSAPLPATKAALGPAFGPAAFNALADTAIVAKDDYGRGFSFRLGDFVAEARERYDFDAQFDAFMAEQDETSFAVGGFGFNLATGAWEAGKPAPSAIFALSTEGGYTLAASYDAPVSARFGLAAEGASSQTDAAMGDSFASPLFSFAEGGLGFSGEIPLGDNGAALAFGMAQGQNSAPDSKAESFASVAEYRHPIGESSSVRVSLGGLVEENTVLGGETGGALAMADGAPTGFAGVSAQFALGDGFSLIGAYHAGVTIAEPGEDSIYTAIDPLVSDSFSAGLRFDGARLWGLASVSQPLRVARGSATLALPSSQNADGSLNYTDTDADLSPDAREINLQLSGGSDTSWGNVIVGGGARLNANHVADAAPEGLVFFKTTASF